MKKLLSGIMMMAAANAWAGPVAADDSLYVASYKVGNGLRVAYSVDKKHWTPIGDNYNLLTSDYGPWGSQKKMASAPSVIRDTDGEWYAVWALDGKVNQFATTHTRDLSCWVPQDYPYMTTTNENVIDPVLMKRSRGFVVMYATKSGKVYETVSKDFKVWSEAKEVQADIYKKVRARVFADIPSLGGAGNGATIAKATWEEIETLIAKGEAAAFRAQRDNQGFGGDVNAFGRVKNLKTTLKANISTSKAISPDLLGIFFEDINYAADGGLYAELIQNRDFEYTSADHNGWNAKTAWKAVAGNANSENIADYMEWSIAKENPISENNASYSLLKVKKTGACLVNEGFEGIPLKAKDKYDLSMFLKSKGKVRVSLVDGDAILASCTLGGGATWKQCKAVLVPKADAAKAKLMIEPLSAGDYALDFVSLFPQKTFKGRKNGMRADLAQALADMKPKFVRFPGGCASHGQGIDNIYHWQTTIGNLWDRKSDFNIWNYHQSKGIGFYEYFQFCEDIGAAALPVLAAGVPCQNSYKGGNGQQGGLPWEKDLNGKPSPYTYMGKPLTMESYLQELLDLIEWANGDPKTSKLAKMRADAGHPKPFGMKYLGIGNEDLISEVFLERYTWLIKEVKKAHPEITVVGTVGPFWEGSDYHYGWNVAHEENIEIVDEHYYNPIGWYINHQDFYDKYPRTGTKVYLGEWASKGNRWENALAEAIHITNVERNADVVVMSSYAPLLAREGHTQWNPDLIYFNNTEVKPTPNYYVQMLAGQNAGSEYIFSDLSVSDPVASKRVSASIVREEGGDVIVKVVNALPVENEITLDLGDILTQATTAVKTQMTANFDARSVEAPKAETVPVADLKTLKLPKYSFTIIRINRTPLR